MAGFIAVPFQYDRINHTSNVEITFTNTTGETCDLNYDFGERVGK